MASPDKPPHDPPAASLSAPGAVGLGARAGPPARTRRPDGDLRNYFISCDELEDMKRLRPKVWNVL